MSQSQARTPEGVDVAPQPTPGARVHVNAPIESFGGGRADRSFDVGGLERTMVDLYTQAKHNANEVAVNDADNQLSGLTTKLLYDDKDGVLNQHGKNAFTAPEQVGEVWEKGVSDIAAKLNPEQRAAFEHRVTARWAAVNETVHRHVAEEKSRYEAQTTNDYIKNRQDDALHAAQATTGFDETKVHESIAEQQAVIYDHGRREGWSDEQIKQEAGKAASKTHSDVINALNDSGQHEAAKDYYDRYKDQLQGAEALQVAKAVQEGSTRGQSQQQFDKIMQDPKIDEAEAIKKARAIKDPEVRDQTESRVRSEFVERRNQTTMVREQNYQDAADFVERTSGRKQPPPSIWAGLSAANREAIDRRREQLQKGLQPVTNWSYFYDKMSLASSDAGKEGFLHENLMAHRYELADTQFEKLTDLQASLRKGEDKSQDLGGYRTVTTIVHDALQGAGINPLAKEGTPQGTLVAQFHAAVDQEVAQFEHDKGKKATPQDIQDITDKLLIKSTVAGSGHSIFGIKWGEQQQPLFQQRANTIREIPPKDLQDIKTALRNQHQVVTDSAIVDLYNRGKAKP